VKDVRVRVEFSAAAGRVDPDVRANTVVRNKVMLRPLSEFDGEACSWLVSVTPKEWAGGPGGKATRGEVRVLVFLGGKAIDPERLTLPAWEQ
jgi:hypothetical protein